MSAYIVNAKHLNYLIAAGLQGSFRDPMRWMVPEPALETDHMRGEAWGPTSVESVRRRSRELTRDTADAVGQMLADENYRSVNHRYAEDEDPEGFFAFDRAPVSVDPVQALKAIRCYEYQSCEHPEWENSEARAFCDALRLRMINKLPGYEEAAWEIR